MKMITANTHKYIIICVQIILLTYVRAIKEIHKIEQIVEKSVVNSTIILNDKLSLGINKKQNSNFLNEETKNKDLNSNRIKFRNNSIQNKTNTTLPEHKHIINASNVLNASLINLIIEQTELMKAEICKSNSEIVKGIGKLVSSISLIKKKLKQITSINIISKDEIILDFTVCINNLNLIRAELHKMNDLLENIKKASCKEFADSQRKYDEAKNDLNKLVESIQNFIRKTNLDFNLLILT